MMIREGAAPACIDCGTTGGYADKESARPTRVGGRCNRCHWAHRRSLDTDTDPERPCQQCGRPLLSARPMYRFCSPRCAARNLSARAKARLAERYKPCRQCRVPMFAADFRTASDWYATNFCSARCQGQWHGQHHGNTPRLPKGAVTVADLGLDPGDLAAGASAAAKEVAAQARIAEATGYTWQLTHPHHFTPAALARLFPHPGGLEAARWAPGFVAGRPADGAVSPADGAKEVAA